jgi:hypothetical protein
VKGRASDHHDRVGVDVQATIAEHGDQAGSVVDRGHDLGEVFPGVPAGLIGGPVAPQPRLCASRAAPPVAGSADQLDAIRTAETLVIGTGGGDRIECSGLRRWGAAVTCRPGRDARSVTTSSRPTFAQRAARAGQPALECSRGAGSAGRGSRAAITPAWLGHAGRALASRGS